MAIRTAKAGGNWPFPPFPPWKRLTAEGRRRFLLAVLTLLLSLLFALALGGAIRDLFLDPALHVFLFLEALPQGLVWGGVLAFLALLAWRKFRWPEIPKQRAGGKGAEDIAGMAELTVLLRRARFSPWARQRLRTRLMHLAVALRCEHEKISPDKAWAEIKQGHWPKNSLVQTFLRGEEKTSFGQALTRVVEALERYAGGGEW